jgi:hypothetical protein
MKTRKGKDLSKNVSLKQGRQTNERLNQNSRATEKFAERSSALTGKRKVVETFSKISYRRRYYDMLKIISLWGKKLT